MSAYPEHLDAYVKADIVGEGDLRAMAVLVELAKRSGVDVSTFDDLVWLAGSFALAAFRDEHVCVELSNVVVRRGEDLVGNWTDDLEKWVVSLSRVPALVTVTNHDEQAPRTPFVLDGDLLYVTRAWHEEVSVAAALRTLAHDRLHIILGGPGTGKTTTVAERIVDLFSSTGDMPPIALAAPTGKAAKRMSQAIESALVRADAPDELRTLVGSVKTQTVHQLLGYNPRNRESRFKYHRNRPMPYALVVIDETSMMSLSMMYRLLDALDPAAQLLLVGDHHQLASVEAGTVLADISTCFEKPGNSVGSSMTMLTTQHRFAPDSTIARLAALVLQGDADGAIRLMQSAEDTDFSWIDPTVDIAGLDALIRSVVDHGQAVIDTAFEGKVCDAMELRNSMQVLCAHRNGRFGVAGWNQLIEQRLAVDPSQLWYVGRPVLVTSNDRLTGLSNGDVGVVCAGPDSSRVAAFSEHDANHVFAVTRLPDVDTVHALTIHKSQGSEYDHAIVVLPVDHSRILTRELLYTGITRSVNKLTIVATAEIIKTAINTPIRRATGLSRRL